MYSQFIFLVKIRYKTNEKATQTTNFKHRYSIKLL
jgi:hypothetical protein